MSELTERANFFAYQHNLIRVILLIEQCLLLVVVVTLGEQCLLSLLLVVVDFPGPDLVVALSMYEAVARWFIYDVFSICDFKCYYKVLLIFCEDACLGANDLLERTMDLFHC